MVCCHTMEDSRRWAVTGWIKGWRVSCRSAQYPPRVSGYRCEGSLSRGGRPSTVSPRRMRGRVHGLLSYSRDRLIKPSPTKGCMPLRGAPLKRKWAKKGQIYRPGYCYNLWFDSSRVPWRSQLIPGRRPGWLHGAQWFLSVGNPHSPTNKCIFPAVFEAHPPRVPAR